MVDIDSFVDQVIDQHKRAASASHLMAKNNKCNQKRTISAMIDAHPVATVLIFYVSSIVTLLTIAGILIAIYGHSCCCY